MRKTLTLGAIALAVLAGFAIGQTSRPVDPNRVTTMRLPLDLPAVGAIDKVDAWTFGRIERVERRPRSDELILHIRTADEQVRQVAAPRAPLAGLARQSGWISQDVREMAGRRDIVERMVAFDLDTDGRLLAMISLEPFNRSDTRLRRAFCR